MLPTLLYIHTSTSHTCQHPVSGSQLSCKADTIKKSATEPSVYVGTKLYDSVVRHADHADPERAGPMRAKKRDCIENVRESNVDPCTTAYFSCSHICVLRALHVFQRAWPFSALGLAFHGSRPGTHSVSFRPHWHMIFQSAPALFWDTEPLTLRKIMCPWSIASASHGGGSPDSHTVLAVITRGIDKRNKSHRQVNLVSLGTPVGD